MATAPKFEIEKNVPVARWAGLSGRESKYPFAKMEVGDSFLIPCSHSETETERRRVTASKFAFLRKNPKLQFVTANCDGGLRVWRTA